jgi:hypothetical protein
MEQSPSWETSPFSNSQEIPRILWNLKFLYCLYNSLPPVPILCQLNPVHAPASHFLKIHLNIILLFTPWSSKCTHTLFISIYIYINICIYTYLFIPWIRVLFEKLTGSQLSKKFPVFYETRLFINAATSSYVYIHIYKICTIEHYIRV